MEPAQVSDPGIDESREGDINAMLMDCDEECGVQCAELYPEDSNLRSLCTTSCIINECGGADYP